MTDNKELKYRDLPNDEFMSEAVFGVLSYGGKDIGKWSEEHDSALGSYKYITLDIKKLNPDIKVNFHDHHHSDKEIIENILKIHPDLK